MRHQPKTNLRQFALAAMFAWGCTPAQAQTLVPVGGDDTIADATLTTVSEGSKLVAKVPHEGVHWTAAGGEGIVYSHLTSPTLAVPSTGPVTLKFTHSYNFEENWDGGAVYVSVNGAVPVYVEASAFTANGYDGLLVGGTPPDDWVSNVFVGQQVFTGMSGVDLAPTLIESIVNLGSLTAGDTVVIEFRGGWDDGTIAAGTNWEISTVEVRDSASTAMLNVDFLDGSAGFSVVSDGRLAGPFAYLAQKHQFEIDGDSLAADRYVVDVSGANTIIDLNGADLVVVLQAGTLEVGDAFTLFDLSGGTTMRGDYSSISLPEGGWDLSQLKVTGQIICKAIGGGLLVSTYDNTSGTSYLNPITNLMAVTPSGTGTQIDDINYGDFLTLPGITNTESLSVLWECWFDVSVDGTGDYTFATASDDGSVIFMDLNDDGDFIDPGELVVDNNKDQGTTVVTGTVALTMPSVHMAIGYYQGVGGYSMAARYKKGNALGWDSLLPINGKSGHFSPSPLAPTKDLTAFSIDPYGDGTILGNLISLTVTNNDPVTALAPTITINGTSVSPASGVAQDFTHPVIYTVTAADGSTRDYTVTLNVIDLPVGTGLAVWLKADAINPNDAGQGRIFGPDSFVKQWNDQSSNNQHAAQALAASQPKYLANEINGLPGVKWDGTGKYLSAPSNTPIQTIFAVCKKDADATTLDGLFCASPGQDIQNIRGDGANWNAPGYRGDGNDFANAGQVGVNGLTGYTHNGQWHVLLEVSASAPSFTYQLGQTSNNRFFNGRIAEFVIYNRALTTDEINAVGSYLSDKYALATTYPPQAPKAMMYALGLPGWPGIIDQSAGTIALTVPFSTNLTTLAPTYTLSGGATCNKASGSPQNFTSPVTYTVTASDLSASKNYTVTVTKAPGTEKDMLAFGPGAVINGTDIVWTVPYGTNVTVLAPTYVISALATCSPASGATVDFTSPVTYTVTAEDLSTKDYTVTVSYPPAPPTTSAPLLWLDAAKLTGLSDGQQVDAWADMSGNNNHAIRQAGSSTGYPQYVASGLNGQPVLRFSQGGSQGDWLKFNRINTIRTVFWVVKENAGLSDGHFLLGDESSYHFHRQSGNGPIWDGGYAHQSIRDGTTKLMGTAVNGTSTSIPAGQYQVISVVTTGNVEANTVTQDRLYTHGSWQGDIAEILIYDKAMSSAEEEEIGSYLTSKYGLSTAYPFTTPQATVFSFGLPGSAGVISGTDITLTVPQGTDVTALAPTYTMSGGATCDKASGSTQDFSAPVTYTVESSDNAITNVYTVTVNFSLWAYGAWNNDADSGIDVDSEYTVAVNFGSSGAATTVNGVPFEASATSGANFAIGGGVATTTDTNNITGSSAALATSFIYDGNPRTVTLSNLNPGQTYETSFFSVGWEASGRILLFSSDGDSLMVDQDKYGDNMGIWISHTFVATDTTKVLSVAKGPGGNDGTMHLYALANRVVLPPAHMLSFGLPGMPAVIDPVAKSINWTVAYGTAVTALAPTYTHDGASASPASGSPHDFTSPVTYTVTSTDGRTNDYAVTVSVTPASTEKIMSNVYFPGLGYAHATDASATSYVLNVPSGTPVSALSPTYDTSPLASGTPVSGSLRNFTTAQTYTITAEDGSQQDYSVAVVPYADYAARVMASNPFAYWPMNEGAGFVAYDNASGNNGSYSNPGVTFGAPGPADENAVNFVGTGTAAMRIPHAAALCPDGPFSVEMWVKPSNVPNVAQIEYVASNCKISDPREGWYLAQDSGGTFGVGSAFVVRMFNRNGVNRACQLYVPIDTVRWYHLVLTWDGTTAKFYADGASNETDQFGTATLTSYFGSTHSDPFTVGIRSDSAWPWAGSAAHLAFYNRALTAAEVQFHATGTSTTLTYAEWASTKYPSADLTNPAADLDGDGVSNFDEYAFGLDPTKGTSVNPIIAGLKKSTGQFSYTRTENSGLAYTVWTSTNLLTWTKDTVASAGQTVTATSGDVQTVGVTLSATAVNGKLFVRVQAQ